MNGSWRRPPTPWRRRSRLDDRRGLHRSNIARSPMRPRPIPRRSTHSPSWPRCSPVCPVLHSRSRRAMRGGGAGRGRVDRREGHQGPDHAADASSLPRTGFDHNVGYGTPEHLDVLDRLGPTPIHRLSFACGGVVAVGAGRSVEVTTWAIPGRDDGAGERGRHRAVRGGAGARALPRVPGRAPDVRVRDRDRAPLLLKEQGRHPAPRRRLVRVELEDAWVWDMFRPARFVSSVRVVTRHDVNVEELPTRFDLDPRHAGGLMPRPRSSRCSPGPRSPC